MITKGHTFLSANYRSYSRYESDEFASVLSLIQSGNEYEAARLVADNKNLINVKLKNFLKDWSNRAGDKNVFLNDMVMMMLGLINDDIDFREVLTTQNMYTVNYEGFRYTYPLMLTFMNGYQME